MPWNSLMIRYRQSINRQHSDPIRVSCSDLNSSCTEWEDPGVLAELAWNWTYTASNKKLSCFLETGEQNHKSYSQNRQRRKFWPQTTPKSKVSPSTEPKDRDKTGAWLPEPFLKRRVCCPRRAGAKVSFTTPHHKWLSPRALQWKPAPTLLPTKPQIREDADVSHTSCLLPADLKIKSFLKSCATVLASVPIGQWTLCLVTLVPSLQP